MLFLYIEGNCTSVRQILVTVSWKYTYVAYLKDRTKNVQCTVVFTSFFFVHVDSGISKWS